MQVFGLPRHVTRGAALASRLCGKERSDEAHRRDALKRWRRARDNGLSAADAAAAVGVSRATLYRWRKLHDQGRLAPRSRRPRRSRWGAMASAFRRRRPLRPISAASKAPPRECPEIRVSSRRSR